MIMNHHNHRHSQGLTLIELLVAVVILALLSGLLVRSYLQHARYQALQSASSATAEWLAGIRKRAMQQNQACSIAVTPSSTTLEAASDNACGTFPALNLSTISSGSATISFCYHNSDPIEPNSVSAACGSNSSNSNATLTFSPRGTNQRNAVFEFFSGTEQAKTCALVIQPNGIIRYGTIRSGHCETNG